MKQKTKILSPYKRKVHVDGQEWSYRITSETIHICDPKRKKKWKFFTNQDDLYPHDWDCDCYWCECSLGVWRRPIRPSQVKKLIQAKILGTIEAWKTQSGTVDNPVRL